MSLCPYFEVWRKQIPKRKFSPDEASHHEIKIAYCNHKNSPATLESARQGLGKSAALKCDGIIRRCPLPEDIRPLPQIKPHARAANAQAHANGTAAVRRAGKTE